MSKLIKFSIVLLLVASVASAVPIENKESALDFVLLHNNDLHAHFEEMSDSGSECTPEEALEHKCYGGFARAATLIKRYRADHQKRNGLPVLFLNGGDTYTGTPYFQMFKDKIASEFMNILKPDVATLGNHGFDLGINGLLPFLRNVSFPIAVANLDIPDDHPLMQTHSVRPSVVFDVNDTKVGVIGYIAPETKNISKSEDVIFSNEIAAINKEAETLTSQGVKIIIALGHSGYDVDQEIARECPMIDLVVGAHSHTFLYTGTPPDLNDKPLGPYPTIIEQPNGKKVPVVQASCYAKYLGKLELSFDEDGNLIRWSGNPILLDYQIPQDAEVIELLAKYRPSVEALTKNTITYSKVELKNDCRDFDCNIGNLITDAFVYNRVQQYTDSGTDSGWTDASVAIMNNGGIRSGATIGNLTKYKLQTILPFQDKLFITYIPGGVLIEVLEFSVKYRGSFSQMSGMRVVYNLQKGEGPRVHSVEVLCATCSVPVYEPLDEQKTYGVILTKFSYEGGDGFSMFKPYEYIDMKLEAADAVINYIHRFESIYPAIEGRIRFIGVNGVIDNVSKSTSSVVKPFSVVVLIVATLLLSQFLSNKCFTW
ncbi:protein 5NUC-like [Contarinia nasturtii]|uniref:protein 5NUC-like n=1 Tax=Contarinia nasturtii TaxID=265458 RepID=UPI0012D401E4|nr:protein 5NUC-like [Contarinia nasturtii]